MRTNLRVIKKKVNHSRNRRSSASNKNGCQSYEKTMRTLLLQNQQMIIQQQNMMFMMMKQFHPSMEQPNTSTVNNNSNNNTTTAATTTTTTTSTAQHLQTAELIHPVQQTHHHQHQQQYLHQQDNNNQHQHHRHNQQQQQHHHQHHHAHLHQIPITTSTGNTTTTTIHLPAQQHHPTEQLHALHQHQDPQSQHQAGQLAYTRHHQQQQQQPQHHQQHLMDNGASQNHSGTGSQQQSDADGNNNGNGNPNKQSQQQQQQHLQQVATPAAHLMPSAENIAAYLTPVASEQDPASDTKPDDDDISALLGSDDLMNNNLLYNPQTDIGQITPFKNHSDQQQTPSYYSSGCESLTTPRVEQQQPRQPTTSNISQTVVKNLADSFRSPSKPKINVQILSGSATRSMKNSKAKIIQRMNISEFLRHVHQDEQPGSSGAGSHQQPMKTSATQ